MSTQNPNHRLDTLWFDVSRACRSYYGFGFVLAQLQEKAGRAALRKKNPRSTTRQQLSGCNDGGGKKKGEQTDVRSFECSHFLTI